MSRPLSAGRPNSRTSKPAPPTFQATIPDILADERDYTRALSLSRLTYDLESVLSSLLAAAAVAVISYDLLFVGTAVGFAASALLVVSALLPHRRHRAGQPRAAGHDPGPADLPCHATASRAVRRALRGRRGRVDGAGQHRGLRAFSAGPRRDRGRRRAGRLRARLARRRVHAARLLDRFCDRTVMLRAGAVLAAALLLGVPATAFLGAGRWPVLLVLWAVIGVVAR